MLTALFVVRFPRSLDHTFESEGSRPTILGWIGKINTSIKNTDLVRHQPSKRTRASRIVDAWLETLSLHASTAYGGVIARLRKAVGDGRLLTISDRALLDFVSKQSPESMQRRAVAALHSFYRFAEKHRYLDRDPSRDIFVKRLPRHNVAEVLRKLSAAGFQRQPWRHAEYLRALSSDRSVEDGELESLNISDRQTMFNTVMHRLKRCKNESDLRSLLRSRIGLQ